MNTYIFTPPALLMAALSGLMGGLAFYAFRRRQEQPGILYFVGLMAALAWWMGGLSLEVSSLSPKTALFWARAEYLGISFIGPLWFLFALQYAEHHRPLPRWLVLLVLGSGLLSLLGAWTNDWHRLWWTEVRFNRDVGPLLVMDARYGPLFWAHAVIAYGYVLAGDLIYLAAFLRAGPLYRYQASLILVAAFIPLLANIAYVLRWINGIPALLLTAFSFALMGGMMLYGLLRYRLLEVLPIARWAVVDHLPDGILVVDPASRIVDLNPAARRLGGMVRREPLGQPLEQAIQPPSLAQALAEACRRAATQPVEGEVRLERSTGLQVLQYTAHPFCDRRGRLLGRILILRDITARVQAEDALRQRSEELDAFARTIAHDLKAPLATVRGYVGVLIEDYGSRLDEEGRRLLARVEEGANRMARMIEDLLLLARAARVEGPMEPVDVGEAIYTALLGLERAIAERRILLTIAPELPTALGHPAWVEQVFSNLLDNAIKYIGEENPAPRVEVGGELVVTQSAEGEVREARFWIRDNGIGIAPEDQERIFQPFTRLLHNHRGGVGLGLAIVRRAVAQMGGRVWVESEVGQGSTFYVALPTVSSYREECGNEDRSHDGTA